MALSERSKNSGGFKDDKIRALEVMIKHARENEAKMDRHVHDLKTTIRKWKDMAEALESD